MRIAVVAAAVCLSVVGLSSARDAIASIRMSTHIPAQSLDGALKALARDRDLQVLYFSDAVKDVRTGGAAGDLTTDEVLKQLLSGTGLTYRYVNDKAITILPVSEASAGGAAPSQPSSSPVNSTPGDDQQEGKKSSSNGFRVAQMDQGQAASSSAVERKNEQTSEKSPLQLQEVLVTAQKKTENLLDVPVPVTAVSADTLLQSGQLRLQDFYTSIPGLSLTPSDFNGAPQLAIRGITTGNGTNPNVAVTVDDVPYGPSTSLAGSGIAPAPDFDPSDLARIEVLRGPQGTLYGASSIGGLLKYVTVDPSTDALSGRVEAGTSSVYNGAELGYSFRGSVNAPLSDTVAVRASGFTRKEPGYVDNVQTGEHGVNREDASGGRLSALWRPSEAFSLKLSAMLQDSKRYGSPDVDVEPGLVQWQQSDLRGTGWYRKSSQAYGATLTTKLGAAELTSLSGYNVDTLSSSTDWTPLFGPFTQAQFGVTGSPFIINTRTSKFSQEFRLSAPIGQSIDWLLGVFYTHERSPNLQSWFAENPATGAMIGTTWIESWVATYAEYAAFTDFTVHLTDRFSVQIGGRESHNRQTYSEVDAGPFVPKFEGFPSPLVFAPVVSNENAFTYLLTPQFKVSPDLMVYARLASGFRPGGPNSEASAFHLPLTFSPDTTKNYEIGVKGDLLDHAFSFDASLYYVNWKNIQLLLVFPSNGDEYQGNGGEAKSQGVELSVESKPAKGLTIAAWITDGEAVLTQAFPSNTAAYGIAGNRLPYSSRFSGNLSLEQDFPMGSRVSGFNAGALSYVGEREGVFTGSPERQIFPAYATTNLRTGAKFDDWTVNIFANNVTNNRGILSGGIGSPITPLAFYYIQPRTVGLSVSKAF